MTYGRAVPRHMSWPAVIPTEQPCPLLSAAGCAGWFRRQRHAFEPAPGGPEASPRIKHIEVSPGPQNRWTRPRALSASNTAYPEAKPSRQPFLVLYEAVGVTIA